MRRILFIILLCASYFAKAQTTEILTNNDIVKLTKLGLPPSSIITKIKNSKSHFDVSVDALVKLKEDQVSGDVVSEMINANSNENKDIANKKDMSDPRTMRTPGIYHHNPRFANAFTAVDPTVVSSSKSGGFGTALAQRYTLGLAKNKERSYLSGTNSRRQIPEARPVFYFYFDLNTTRISPSLWWFNSAASPNEFALLMFKQNDDNREMVVATSNSYSHNIGIDEKQKIEFKYEQVAEGIYKVVPAEPLEKGEYCFVYTGSVPTTYSNNKVFDFGINVPSSRK